MAHQITNVCQVFILVCILDIQHATFMARFHLRIVFFVVLNGVAWGGIYNCTLISYTDGSVSRYKALVALLPVSYVKIAENMYIEKLPRNIWSFYNAEKYKCNFNSTHYINSCVALKKCHQSILHVTIGLVTSWLSHTS